MKQYKAYINGAFVETPKYDDVYNPATEEIVCQVADCGPEEIAMAIDAAYEAQKAWRKVPSVTRAKYILKLADLVEEHLDELALLLAQEQGKPLGEAQAEMVGGVELLRYHAGWDRRYCGEIMPGDNNSQENILVMKEPIGVVGCIMPWNFPIYVLMRKIAPALVVGCTVICKPSSDTPASTLAIASLVEEAGFPAGTVNFVTGRGSVIGPALAKNEKVALLALTGSEETGQELIRLSADTVCKVSLELGGKAPVIVMDDADLELAADAIAGSRLFNCGQVCNATERVYVQRGVADKLIQMLKERFEKTVIGYSLEKPDATMGPLVNKSSKIRIEAMVERALAEGAVKITDMKAPEGKGNYFAPVLLTNVKQNSEIMQEEIFGPVLPVYVFDTAEEALELANDSRFGLTSGLFTKDYRTVMLFANNIEAGEFYVNRRGGEAYHGFHAGWKHSGIGGDDGPHGLDEFLRIRTVYLDY